jgi:hypothetical protein
MKHIKQITETDIEYHLRFHGHGTIEDWGLDQGYYYDKREDIWLDDEGKRIDLEDKLIKHLEDELNNYE